MRYFGTASLRQGLADMVRNSTSIAWHRRVRLVLFAMVAVAASMTLHHGAMASGPKLAHTHGVAAHHGADCHHDCEGAVHSMPICCGIGLCLTGLPVKPENHLRIAPISSAIAGPLAIDTRWPIDRIDRPPKSFLERA